MGNLDAVCERAAEHVRPLLRAGETIEKVTMAAFKQPSRKAQVRTAVVAGVVGAAFGGVGLGLVVTTRYFVILTNERLLVVGLTPRRERPKPVGGIQWAVERDLVRASEPYKNREHYWCFDLVAEDDGSLIVTVSFGTTRTLGRECEALSAGLGRRPVEAVPVPEPVAAPDPVPVALPPPDWYPDPSGRHARRYWDGTTWTGFAINHAGLQLFESGVAEPVQ
jgi:hypothetical protein